MAHWTDRADHETRAYAATCLRVRREPLYHKGQVIGYAMKAPLRLRSGGDATLLAVVTEKHRAIDFLDEAVHALSLQREQSLRNRPGLAAEISECYGKLRFQLPTPNPFRPANVIPLRR